jgi:hypothetical protein
MNRKFLWPVIAALVIGLVAVCYPRRAPEPPPVPVELPEPAPSATPGEPLPFEPPAEPEPAPDFVVAEPSEPPPPLPALADSDTAARAALGEAAGAELVEQYIVADGLIRKLVATVDNLPREALWIKSRVIPPLDGLFLVEGPEDAPTIATANYARYTPLARLVGAVDAKALAQGYQRHYPLLQEAYEELGYPGRQFHNRALEVIDHLLATPRVTGPVRLERPHVLYRYADPRLEALSPGQKALLRVGPDNAAIIRAKLIELRAALEDLAAAPGAD